MASGSAPLTEPKKVDLDRPFFFMIMDSEFNMPFFMGVLNDIT
jgi:serine protease inhibitor